MTPAAEKVTDKTWQKEKCGILTFSRQFHKGWSVTSWWPGWKWQPVRLQSIFSIHSTLWDSLSISDHMDQGWGGSLQGHPKLLSLIATIMPSSLQGAFTENGAMAPQDWCHCTLDYKRATELCPAAHTAQMSSYPSDSELNVAQGNFLLISIKLHAFFTSIVSSWNIPCWVIRYSIWHTSSIISFRRMKSIFL